MDGSYHFWINPGCLCNGSKCGFCCPGFLNASVVQHLESQECIHRDAQPACRRLVESYKTISNTYVGSQFQSEVYLVVSSASDQYHFHFCDFELLPWSICPLDALHCATLKYCVDLINIASSHHPAEVVHKALPFECRYILFDPFDQC